MIDIIMLLCTRVYQLSDTTDLTINEAFLCLNIFLYESDIFVKALLLHASNM